MTGFSLLPTKPNQTGRGTEGCRAVSSPNHPKPLTRGEPMGEKKKTKPEQSQLLPPALPPSWLCKRVRAEPTCPAPQGLCSDPEALTLGRNSYRRPRRGRMRGEEMIFKKKKNNKIKIKQQMRRAAPLGALRPASQCASSTREPLPWQSQVLPPAVETPSLPGATQTA